MMRILMAVAIVFLCSGGWAQGSKPAKVDTSTKAGNSEMVSPETGSTILIGSGKRGWIRVHGNKRNPDSPFADRIDFVDDHGMIRKTIEPRRGKRESMITTDPTGRYAVILEDPGIVSESKNIIITFLDDEGNKSWDLDLCCDVGGWYRVHFSEDGSLLAVTDVGEGGTCVSGEDGYTAPPGCLGLRIMRPSGEVVYQEVHGSDPLLSPHGQYAAFRTPDGYRLLDVKRNQVEKIPAPPCGTASAVHDDGLVGFSYGPGCPGRVYVSGKGLVIWDQYKEEYQKK